MLGEKQILKISSMIISDWKKDIRKLPSNTDFYISTLLKNVQTTSTL